jgi:C1A family cysteine protease
MVSTSKKQYILALFLILALAGITNVMSRKLYESPSLQERHEQWMVEYGKVYEDAAEKETRFQIFKDNVEFIESFNAADNKPYKLSVNHLADLTIEEFKASRNGYKKIAREFNTTSFKYENVTAIPAAVDWRLKGAVTPIKDQGQCGKINNIIHKKNTLLYDFLLLNPLVSREMVPNNFRG